MFVDMKKLILWESSCFGISPEIFVVWLKNVWMKNVLDEELLAAQSNWLAVNRIFSGRYFVGCLSFVRSGKVVFLES